MRRIRRAVDDAHPARDNVTKVKPPGIAALYDGVD